LLATAKNVHSPIDTVSFFIAGLQFEQLFQAFGQEQFANKIDTGVTSFVVDGKSTEPHLSLKNNSSLILDVGHVFSLWQIHDLRKAAESLERNPMVTCRDARLSWNRPFAKKLNDILLDIRQRL
jgi:hypothetical protein